MKIRIIFQCSRCGSITFRSSTRRSLKDSILRKIGFNPHRCYLCRRRFYLFKPMSLRAFLMALDSQANAAADATAADHMLDATDARKWVRQNSNV
jgi:hypothetical protein